MSRPAFADRHDTAHECWEYLLVAHPDEPSGAAILQEKKLFHSVYAPAEKCAARPHITIASFQAKEAMEATLVRWIQNICHLQEGFEVALNNFSGIPPHTIYLRVQDPQPFAQLANKLKIIEGFIESNDCPPMRLSARPHLALAEHLSEPVYTEAIQAYAQQTFHARFFVNRLVLIKKWWEGGRYELVNTFSLAPPKPL